MKYTDPYFYEFQQVVSNIYGGKVTSYHIEKANLVKEWLSKNQGDILELGAGGGQMVLALSNVGYDVTGLELNEVIFEQAESLIQKKENARMIQGDFYNWTPSKQYDVITYFDGFGLDSDDQQRYLLERLHQWLKPNGYLILEVYTPWYWANIANEKSMNLGQISRKYTFDAQNCRLIDTWFEHKTPQKKHYQSLRCYSPADLKLLIKDLFKIDKIDKIEAGGAVDYENKKYSPKVELCKSMSYVVLLSKVIL